jgi:hypothetical protein
MGLSFFPFQKVGARNAKSLAAVAEAREETENRNIWEIGSGDCSAGWRVVGLQDAHGGVI